jgi:hypothetical protein
MKRLQLKKLLVGTGFARFVPESSGGKLCANRLAQQLISSAPAKSFDLAFAYKERELLKN